MSTQLNSRHAKNLANLERFIQAVSAMGSVYNPGNVAIDLIRLQNLKTMAENRLHEVNITYAAWKKATRKREITFASPGKLATRILDIFSTTNAPLQTKDELKNMCDQLVFGKISEADTTQNSAKHNRQQPVPGEERIADKHLGFDKKFDIFGKIIMFLHRQPLYLPNEEELTLDCLQSTLVNLRVVNNAAFLAWVDLTAARISRNHFFYAEHGLLDTLRQAKAYVKSLEGAGSKLYKTIKCIRFMQVIPLQKAG